VEILNSIQFWALVVAAIGISVSIYFQRKSHPKKELLFSDSVTELMPTKFEDQNVKLIAKKATDQSFMVLENAHLIKIKMWSNSRVDIGPEDFAGGEPIRIHLKTDLISIIGKQLVDDLGQSLIFRTNNKSLVINPCIIKRNHSVEISVLCRDKPNLVVEQNLKNANIVRFDDPKRLIIRYRKFFSLISGAFWTVVSILMMLLIIVGIVAAVNVAIDLF
jgi:hypothetical protein